MTRTPPHDHVAIISPDTKMARENSFRLMIAAFEEMDEGPRKPRRLARFIDRRLSVAIDLGLFDAAFDEHVARRDMFNVVHSLKRKMKPVMEHFRGAGPWERSGYTSHAITSAHAYVADQIVALEITDPEERRKHADQLLAAMEYIMDFCLRHTLVEDQGRRPGDDITINIAIVVREHLIAFEGQDFATIVSRRNGKKRIWNKRAIAIVETAYRALGIKSRLRTKEIVRRVFDAAHPPELSGTDASAEP